MRTDTKDIACKVAYLIGVKKDFLHNNFDQSCPEVIEQLENDQNATVIRYLCKLRTSLMKNFKNTDFEIKFNLKNIDRLDWFDTDNVKWLEKHEIGIILANKKAADYSVHINKLIAERFYKKSTMFKLIITHFGAVLFIRRKIEQLRSLNCSIFPFPRAERKFYERMIWSLLYHTMVL